MTTFTPLWARQFYLLLLVTIFTTVSFTKASAQFTPQTLPFSQNWTNIGLITVNDVWTSVPGISGFRGDDITTATATDPQTLVADGSAVIDVNANQSNPDAFATGGVTEFELANPVIALQGSGTADAPHIVIRLNTTGFTSILFSYNLRDIDGSLDNAIQPVALQYRIGNSGDFINIPAGFVADATTGPSVATLVTAVSVTLPAACNNEADVQIRIITTNAIGNDEWVGIDDIIASGTALVCNISSVSINNVSACNNNGTPGSAADDYYTGDITVNFTNAPASGTLRIEPGNPNVLDAVDVPVGSLVGNTHTFTGVRLRTTGAIFGVELEFSADNACVRTLIAPAVTSCSAAPPNDLCVNATPIPGTGNYCGTTLNATPDNPNGGADCVDDADGEGDGVWYTFTGDGNQWDFNFPQTGVGFNWDPEINVYTGSCGAWVCETGDDDTGGGLDAIFSVNTVLGTTYYVYVHPASGSGGTSDFCFDVNIINACQTPTVDPIANQPLCNGSSTTAVIFTGSVPGTVYNWTNNTASIGLGASGTGNIASFAATNATNAPVVATITVTPTLAGCPDGLPVNFTITVNPTPNAIATPASQSACSGTAISTIILTSGVAGTTYTWTRDNTIAATGIAANGNGNISGTLTNTTNAPVIVTFTITPTASGCPGTPIQATVTVNPTPTATATPASQAICSGTAITTIALTGTVTGTTYNWTRDNTGTVTGIAANGSGNISGSLTNTTGAPVIVTFTITPTANSCAGTPILATVTVNPAPTAIATPAAQLICNTAAITTIVLSSATPSTTYTWTRDNTANVTGIAANGNGDISGSLTNTTNAAVTVTFTIIPTANGCAGSAIQATVIVQPTATVDDIPNQTVCDGTQTAPVMFTSPVPGVTYNWINNTPSIGLAANGAGNIAAFTATNPTLVPVTATITVTPTIVIAGVCSMSSPQTFANNTPVVIPTGPGVITSTINVAGAPDYLYDLNILTSIRHTFNGDLDITIQSPSGKVVTLTSDNGAGSDNVFNGTLWDDNANPSGQVPYTANNGLVGDHTYVNLTTATPLAPEEPLAAFIGDNPNGIWTITVSDDAAGDGGSLDAWSLIISGLPGAPTLTSTSASNNTVVAIPTGPGVITSTINIAGAGTQLHDVNLTTFIRHTFNGDLDITLTSPSGTVVTLTSDNGAGNDDVFNGTVWNDGANPAGQVPYTTNNGLVTDHNYTNLTLASPLAPEEALGAFIGEDPNGTWTLTISDDAAGDGGSLDSWTLNLQTAACNLLCTGPPKVFTITVNPLPTITCPGPINVPSAVGACTAVVNYTPTVTGTPAPTLTYELTGATTGSGSGSGSGTAFRVGVTTVKITATNGCATVSCSFIITVTDSQLPQITAQPVNKTVCTGSNATFSVTAITTPSANGPLSYQWQSWNGSTWNSITGATASSYTVNNVTPGMNTNSYRVIVTGLCTPITSTHATLYVNPLPTITLATSIAPNLLPTQVLSITATTSPSGGTYVWQKNGQVISGANGPVLSGLTVSDAGVYRLVYTDPNGCTSTSSEITVTAQQSGNLFVYPVPNFGQFTVRFYHEANEKVTVRVIDAKGAVVHQQAVQATLPYTTINIDLSTGRIVTSGTYIVELVGANGRRLGAKAIIIYKQ